MYREEKFHMTRPYPYKINIFGIAIIMCIYIHTLHNIPIYKCIAYK